MYGGKSSWRLARKERSWGLQLWLNTQINRSQGRSVIQSPKSANLLCAEAWVIPVWLKGPYARKKLKLKLQVFQALYFFVAFFFPVWVCSGKTGQRTRTVCVFLWVVLCEVNVYVCEREWVSARESEDKVHSLWHINKNQRHCPSFHWNWRISWMSHGSILPL